MPNAALLRAVGDRIAAHPDLYDQGEWGIPVDDDDCGTYGCVAGHAVDLADGYALAPDFPGAAATLPDGRLVLVEVAARHALDLDISDAETLFAGSWRPAGWYAADDRDREARLVRDALHALADGATIDDVTAPRG